MHSLLTDLPAPPRVWREPVGFHPLDARSHHSLNYSTVPPNHFLNQLVHFDHLWRPLEELVQSSDWLFRSSNAQKNYGTGSNSSVILLTPRVPSEHS